MSKDEFEEVYDYNVYLNGTNPMITTYVLTGEFPIEELPNVNNNKITITYRISKVPGGLKIVDMMIHDQEQNNAFHRMKVNVRHLSLIHI